jgi:hypothetical protein
MGQWITLNMRNTPVFSEIGGSRGTIIKLFQNGNIGDSRGEISKKSENISMVAEQKEKIKLCV